MDEIINITYFLTKQGICKDMQKIILSYYDQETYINLIEITDRFDDSHKQICVKYDPNKTNYKSITKQIFEIIKLYTGYYDEYMVISDDVINLSGVQYSIEKLAEQFEFNKIKHTTRMWYAPLDISDICIKISTIKLQTF